MIQTAYKVQKLQAQHMSFFLLGLTLKWCSWQGCSIKKKKVIYYKVIIIEYDYLVILKHHAFI